MLSQTTQVHTHTEINLVFHILVLFKNLTLYLFQNPKVVSTIEATEMKLEVEFVIPRNAVRDSTSF